MDIRPFHRRLFMATQTLIPPHSRIVCAVSGGSDSMAMLHGLLAVNEIHDRHWRFQVAHVNHALRPESAADAQFVADTASGLGLSCTIESVDIRSEAASAGESIETAARRIRYTFFERAADRSSAPDLLTAESTRVAPCVSVGHTADDQAETVLHRIARGTGLHGLAGMSRERTISPGSAVRVVRPMLGFRRSELVEYLKAAGLAFVDDSSNVDASYTRNRIRHSVLPMLAEQVNPQAVDALVRLADQARRSDEALVSLARAALVEVRLTRPAPADEDRRSDDGPGVREVAFSATDLAHREAAVRTEVLRLLLRELGAAEQAVTAERLHAADALVTGDGARRTVEFPERISIERRGDRMTIRRRDAKEPSFASLTARSRHSPDDGR